VGLIVPWPGTKHPKGWDKSRAENLARFVEELGFFKHSCFLCWRKGWHFWGEWGVIFKKSASRGRFSDFDG
jgi:hypothetical protein